VNQRVNIFFMHTVYERCEVQSACMEKTVKTHQNQIYENIKCREMRNHLTNRCNNQNATAAC